MSWFEWDLQTIGALVSGLGFTVCYMLYAVLKNQDEMKKDIKNIVIELRNRG